MAESLAFRNYRLSGNADAKMFEHSDWYACPVPRKRMKELMKRSDGAALRDFGLWLLLLLAAGILALESWGTWVALPAFLVYGVLYASAAESRFHECLHGTPFKTRWINETFLWILGLFALKNPYFWRWSHARHHTDTIVVGRDPEIAFPRPPDIWGMLLNMLHLRAGTKELSKTLRHSAGFINEEEREFIPAKERSKVVFYARLQTGLLAAVVAWSVAANSFMPLLFFGLPTFYGSWLHSVLAAMQHAGLAEDIPDHRLNSRTVYLNPAFSFVYANMNYHVEHHMFPLVPYYALSKLHEEIRADCPPAYRGLWDAYREILPALRRQLKNPGYFVQRSLPAGSAS
ncbi:MAG: fatty acid desaturase [Albidovulum sp.]|nr:fatty acid desaturase [Albidovulum sp.]